MKKLACLFALSLSLVGALGVPAVRSQQLGPDGADNRLDVYFSVGCPHCLLYLSSSLDQLVSEAKAGRLQVAFHEIPGAIAPGPNKAAREIAQQASYHFFCLGEQKGARAFAEGLQAFIDRLRKSLSTRQLPPNSKIPAWQNWVHATDADLLKAAPVKSVSDLASQATIDPDVNWKACNVATFLDTAKARYKTLTTLNPKPSYPTLVLNGEIKRTSIVNQVIRNTKFEALRIEEPAPSEKLLGLEFGVFEDKQTVDLLFHDGNYVGNGFVVAARQPILVFGEEFDLHLRYRHGLEEAALSQVTTASPEACAAKANRLAERVGQSNPTYTDIPVRDALARSPGDGLLMPGNRQPEKAAPLPALEVTYRIGDSRTKFKNGNCLVHLFSRKDEGQFDLSLGG